MIDTLAISEPFTFLRPWFLVLLPVLLAGYWFSLGRIRGPGHWQDYLDPRLATWLLRDMRQGKNPYRWPKHISVIGAAVLFVIGLAGPSWSSRELPLYQPPLKLFILADLSPSMLAKDGTPNRLATEKFKILETLKNWRGGEVGLIIFAADAYLLAPLSEDTVNIQNIVPLLSPRMVPAPGSAADRAVAMVLKTLTGTRTNAQILLLTDGISKPRQRHINVLLKDSHVRLTTLLIGSAAGAPFPNAQNTGFQHSADGAIVIVRVQSKRFSTLANNPEVRVLHATRDNSDIRNFLTRIQPRTGATEQADRGHSKPQRIDFGAFFLWPVLLLTIPLLKRRSLSILLPILLTFSTTLIPSRATFAAERPNTAQHNSSDSTTQDISFWDKIWNNRQQLGDKAFQQHRYKLAGSYYQEPLRRGNVLYRQKKYKQAEKFYRQAKGKRAQLNLANSLYQRQQITPAIDTLERLLKQAPNYLPAKKNLAFLKSLKKNKTNQSKAKNKKHQRGKNGKSGKNNKPGSRNDKAKKNTTKKAANNASHNHSNNSSSPNDTAKNKSNGQASKPLSAPASKSNSGASPAEKKMTPGTQHHKPKGESAKTPPPPDFSKTAATKKNQDKKKKTRPGGSDNPFRKQASQQGKQGKMSPAQRSSLTRREQSRARAEKANVSKSKSTVAPLSQENQQWLRRIPDDPARLWRNKMLLESRKRQHSDPAPPSQEEW